MILLRKLSIFANFIHFSSPHKKTVKLLTVPTTDQASLQNPLPETDFKIPKNLNNYYDFLSNRIKSGVTNASKLFSELQVYK